MNTTSLYEKIQEIEYNAMVAMGEYSLSEAQVEEKLDSEIKQIFEAPYMQDNSLVKRIANGENLKKIYDELHSEKSFWMTFSKDKRDAYNNRLDEARDLLPHQMLPERAESWYSLENQHTASIVTGAIPTALVASILYSKPLSVTSSYEPEIITGCGFLGFLFSEFLFNRMANRKEKKLEAEKKYGDYMFEQSDKIIRQYYKKGDEK